MGDGLLSLNWNNHGATFCHTLASLRGKDKYTDVTVSCDGKFYQVHKLVLSTCSEYFEKIFENTPCKHPVIVLRDVHSEELESLLNYMYKGVVSVAQNDLSRLIKVAELLQIKGLAVPDEPPSSSKSSKRTSDDRSNADHHSSSSSSPYPKRRRRRESDHYQPSTSTSSAPQQQRNEESATWSEDRDSRHTEDRLHEPNQDRVHSPVTVNVDETLIKEEIPDNDDQNDILEDYGNLGLDPPSGGTSGEASQDATAGLMIPKFDEAKDDDQGTSAVTLPDPVVEALAGPSGLQGWTDGGDMARGMPLGEGFSGSESQDMSPSVGLPPPGQQPRQMITLEDDEESIMGAEGGIHSTLRQGYQGHGYQCPFCSYQTLQKTHLKEHIRTHTGEKPFACPHCPFRFSQKINLTRHIRIHTGEKPFACTLCPYRATQGTLLKKHIANHHAGAKI